jgi:MFS family permease
VLLLATGIFYTLWGTNALSTIQLEAPEHLRGRAAALYFFAFQGGAPIGGLLAGWLVSSGGTRLAFVLGGLVSVITAAWGVLWLARDDVDQSVSISAAASSIWRSLIPR